MDGKYDQPQVSGQLNYLERAHNTEPGSRILPVLVPPIAGLLGAGGFIWLGVAELCAGQTVYFCLSFGFFLPFFALLTWSGRVVGVVTRPELSLTRRVLRQVSIVLPFLLAGMTTIFFGLAGLLFGMGIGLGVTVWIQLDSGRRNTANLAGADRRPKR